jgi:hypothetical protein
MDDIGDESMSIFGNPWFGLGANLLFGGQQQGLNQQTRAQQEALFGQAQGMLGFGGLPGIPATPPPPGMDISQFPGQAQGLVDPLRQQSALNQYLTQSGLGQQFDPIMRDLQGLPRTSGIMGHRLLDRFGQQTGGIAGRFQQGAEGLLSQFGQGAQGLRAQMGRGATGLLSQFGQGAQGLRSQFGAGAAGITGGFEDRLGRAMGMLEGRGQQAEEDIATRFRESLGAQQQGLAARGFGGTMAANIAQGSAREESAEQRRLQEQLRGEQLGLFTNLSGQGLAARERLLGAGTGLGQQLLGAQVGLGQQLLGAGTGLGQQLLGAGTGLGQQLLGAGTNLQAGFAGQQLQAGQGLQQLLAGLRLSSLGQQGGLGQFMQQMFGQAGQQNLANQFQFGQFPIGVGQQVAGQAFGMLGPFDVRSPQQLQFPQIPM